MHQVFANLRVDPEQPLALPRPGAVVVVGLGEEGRLRTSDLITPCARARWPTRSASPNSAAAAKRLRAGGHAGRQRRRRHARGQRSAQAIAQGVAEANQRLRANGWPVVTRLRLVELYLDRAIEAQRALATLAQSRPAEFTLRADHRERHRAAAPPVRLGLPRRRLRLHHRGAASATGRSSNR